MCGKAMLEFIRERLDEDFVQGIKIGFVIILLGSIVLMTENPISHLCSIETGKRYQFEIMRIINSTSTKQRMRVLFEHDYDYIELIHWTNSQLNFSDSKPDPVPKDPLDIIELGYGRCGEFCVLYASACLAHGYNTRLVVILRGSDHEWVEVQIDGEWIHVDPSCYPEIHVNEPEMYKERNKTLHLVVAFEENNLEVVTDKYQ